MKIVARSRQSGKTTELLKLMAEDENLIYLAATHTQAIHAHRQATRAGNLLPANRFLSAGEVAGKQWPPKIRFLVDELDDVLQTLLGRRAVDLATFTGQVDRYFHGEEI